MRDSLVYAAQSVDREYLIKLVEAEAADHAKFHLEVIQAHMEDQKNGIDARPTNQSFEEREAFYDGLAQGWHDALKFLRKTPIEEEYRNVICNKGN